MAGFQGFADLVGLRVGGFKIFFFKGIKSSVRLLHPGHTQGHLTDTRIFVSQLLVSPLTFFPLPDTKGLFVSAAALTISAHFIL